ncbi:hypothetical protein [Zunongwangia pacifica]|uniref:Uncharacterized protein n=1 Tax=Zunongwangia pacifica TaxID=2911062 RepID=A0A9X2CPR7_9FLAO|nr:hypothetical protein [Zunongwangia pacifica]MCL6220469.1 hypothetical protein [Zunongwangia pacifica]
MIPSQSTTSVSYVDENTNQLLGSSSEKQTIVQDIDSGNDEESFATNVETQFIILSIYNKNLTIEITLGKSRGDQTTFTIENIEQKMTSEYSRF